MAILTPETVYRRYAVDGVPDSGPWKPKKSEIIRLLNGLFGVSRGGWVVARTRTELLAVTPEMETDGGVVLNDPNPAYNGYYQRDAGAWVRERGFPDTLAVLENIGGSANAITADAVAGVDPSTVQMIVLPDPAATNTSGAVTISINGGTAAQVKAASGGNLVAGDILEGVGTFFFRVGSEWRQFISSRPGAAFDHQGNYDNDATYTQGQFVTGSNGNWYQLKAASATGDDPVTDGSGNWLLALTAAALPDGSVTEEKVTSTSTDALRVTISNLAYPRGLVAADSSAGAANKAAIELALASKKYVELPDLEIYVATGIVMDETHRRLSGHGRRKTILKNSNNSTAVISIPSGIVYTDVIGMTIDRSITAVNGGDGIKCAGSVNLLEFSDLEILNQYVGMNLCSTGFSTIRDYYIHENFSHGIFMTNTPGLASTLQWYVGHGLFEANNGWGLLAATTLDVEDVEMGDLEGIKTFANKSGGLGFIGLPTTKMHGVRIKNGFIGGDGYSEIYLDTYGFGHAIEGPYVELSGKVATGRGFATAASGIGCGIELTAHNDEVSISGVKAHGNSEEGIRSLCTGKTQILGGSIRGNNVGIGLANGGNASIMATKFELNTVTDISATSNLANVQLVGVLPTTLGNRFMGGIAVGAPTGGIPTTGLVNVSGGLLKNNGAYTNP